MSIPATNRSMFNQSETRILQRGLHTMTLACDALTSKVDALTDKIEELQSANSQLLSRLDTYKRLESPE